MTNVDNFKSFVKKHPNLINYVKKGDMSWQKFYEMYDIYGEEDNIWNDYLVKTNNENKERKKNSTNYSFSNLIEMTKNLDTNKIQEGITSLQKTISLFGDILLKDKNETSSNYTPRPIYRRFDD